MTQAYAIGKAYDGGQFAELNCQAYGALYQDVLTVPGATLNWIWPTRVATALTRWP